MSTTQLKVHDHRKELPQVYAVKPGPAVIEQLPRLQYVSQEMTSRLNMDWIGHPEPTEEPWIAWKVGNQLKQITKKRMDYQFKLMPHEIVWKEWHDRDHLSYSYMMQVPDLITNEMFDEALSLTRKNWRSSPFPNIRFVGCDSGWYAHKLHIGPHSETRATLQEIRRHVEESGYRVIGNPRDIYLTPSMGCYASPETWRTIVRVEVEKNVR